MTTSPRTQTKGSVLAGRYVVRRKLGAGGLGTVYLAYDQEAGRRVALKILRTDRLSSEAVRDLQAEFRTIAGLRHPRIAPAFDFGYLREGAGAPIPYYTREYVEGEPLPGGPPGNAGPAEFLRPVLDLLEALEYLHASGISHRDVHAGNLIVGEDAARGAVLIDLGFFESLHRRGTRSVSSGSSINIPPESLRAGAATGPEADVFMAGRLLHYRLTGRADGEIRLPPEIPGWGARTTLALERIASKAVQPDPARRFASAGDLRRALSDALGAEPLSEAAAVEPADLLVGREGDVEWIDRTLRRFTTGQSAIAWIHGEPGVGRSRLLRELRLRAQLGGFRTIDVSFVRGSGPRAALLDVLRGAKLGPGGEQGWLSVLAAEHGGTPAERAARAARAFFEDGGEPLLLLLDDLDAADGESRSLVMALVAEFLRRNAGGAGSARTLYLGVVSTTSESSLPRRFVRRLRPLSKGAQAELFTAFVNPLGVSRQLLGRVVERGRGSPLRIKQIGLALREAWAAHGTIPSSAELPAFVPDGRSAGLPARLLERADSRAVLGVLAAIDRPARRPEIAAGAGLDANTTRRVLEKLREAELVVVSRQGRQARFQLDSRDVAAIALRSLSSSEVRRVHVRMAAFLAREGRRDAQTAADRARHLVGGARQREGRELALEAARRLRGSGFFESARQVLEAALAGERSRRNRLTLIEALSAILEEVGDHEDGITLIEPFHNELKAIDARPAHRARRVATAREGVRIRRLLGVHYHRAGRSAEALATFEEASRSAHARRDIEDLIFIDSELAELYTYRGQYELAEAACTRGLLRLEALGRSEFRPRMEVILRATLGHLELRRMNLDNARAALRAALELAGAHGTRAIEAVVLNNLGIVERQSNRFGEAVRCFRRAKRILSRAREGRSVIKIACNLALIAAHRGELSAARDEMEHAARLLRHHPGQRLEFFVTYTQGIVAQLFGDVRGALSALEAALGLGRSLGDAHLVAFGEVYLAEALLFCGRYTDARRRLSYAARAARAKSGQSAALLARMVAARGLVVETLLGNERARSRIRKELARLPSTGALLPEAWNDLFIAFAQLFGGDAVAPPFRDIEGRLRGLRTPAGVDLAACGRSLEHVLRGESRRDRPRALPRTRDSVSSHALLAVAEPLVAAAAAEAEGDADSATELLRRAADAIVGRPFLEIDLWIEVLRARIAFRDGDLGGARRHVYRGLRMREALSSLVPARSRAAFDRQPRFGLLRELESRVASLPRVVESTKRVARLDEYHGIVGSSTPMLEVFQLIERLRDQVVPVLVRGETGTGKELVARALHRTSPHGEGPFLALHCGSLPDELFEAELCGYEAGAFTGAERSTRGILEELSGGTVLLDDVHELSPAAQAKLLHIVDAGVVRRLGGTEVHALDVRVIASSSVDLESAIDGGAFRRDLYHRLRVVEIELPALRRRRADIPLLARHLLAHHASRMDRPVPVIDPDALRVLHSHHWPGNVRELETVLVRALVTQSSGVLRGSALSAFFGESTRGSPGGESFLREDAVLAAVREERALKDLRRELEASYLGHLFREVDGDLESMMDVLGVRKTQLYDLFRRAGLDVQRLRRGE